MQSTPAPAKFSTPRLWWREPDDVFDQVIPWLKLSGGGRAGRVTPRIELAAGTPSAIAAIARGLRRPCAGCGREIVIVRDRTVGFPGGAVSGASYVSILCSRPGCYRGRARGAYIEFVEHVTRSKPRQGALI